MDNKASLNVLNLYVKANKNKHEIIDDNGDRHQSVAEATVMDCINELLSNNVNKDKRIRYLLLNSLNGSISGLKKEEEYKRIIQNTNFIKEEISDKEAYANYLKLGDKIRQGHIYWGVNADRLESVLEHIYGCLVIILGIESEYNYLVDYDKVIKMLLLHETEEIIIGDLTEWDISPEEKEKMGSQAVNSLLSNLKNGEELLKLIDEFNNQKTLESEYAKLCDKLEYDMQVKMYELEGRYDFEHYPVNVVTQSDRVQTIIQNGATSVFDVHYEYDKSRYFAIPCMRRILEEAKKY